MKINIKSIQKTCPEAEIFESVLSLNHQNILELGCGDATLTRLIATTGEGRLMTATEVDTIQHEKNLLADDLSNVTFKLAGSENIPVSDNSLDTVFMFKSFHHVPEYLMDRALQEVKRVLKPDGITYISEPIFAGEFNEVLRLFHDEEAVRKAAFEAIKKTVNDKVFTLVDELFFNTPATFDNFEQFEEIVIGVTHSKHQLSDELYASVKQKFEHYHAINSGNFLIPIRVDILQKNSV
jgi:ubiquinone/menaquinone biosynthesis C-methylase UbiE